MENELSVSQMNPLERIQVMLPSMSKKQAKVANYILENFDSVPFYTLAALSANSNVSEASIIRLTSTLGYAGFTEMQRALQDVVKNQISMSKRMDLMNELGTDSTSIMHMVMQKGIEGLQRTMLVMNQKNFQEAVDLLANAKRVFMFGARSSYSLIQFFALELRWIRNDVYALSTQSSEFDAISDLQKGDVFFSISMPRYLRSTTNAMSLAFKEGIPTIGITDSLTSPLIPYTTVPLLVDNEIFSYCDNTVPVIATITALLNAVGTATYPKSNEILARNEKTWKYFNLYLR